MAAFLTSLAAPVAVFAALVLPLTPTGTAQARIPPRFYGVNLAGAEFAPEKLPGVPGKDYVYPTAATAAPFRAMGMNSVRLPVRWERLQPDLAGPLNREELARLDASLNDLSGFRQVIIDVHNYARYRDRLLNGQDGSAEALAAFWTQLANRYKNRPNIAFGIMNEPYGIGAREWRSIAQDTVAAIRRTGATNLVLVPGTRWSGGHSWHVGGPDSNAAALSGFVDPGRNLAYDIHQYLDEDSSGSKNGCSGARAGRQRLERVTRWLREQRAQAVLGEFGGDRSPGCLAALDDLLGFMAENGDVWIGWNYWAGGDWWGDYPLTIQPDKGRERPQAAVLRKHIASYAGR